MQMRYTVRANTHRQWHTHTDRDRKTAGLATTDTLVPSLIASAHMVAMREFDTGIPVDEAVHNSLQLCARYLHVQVLRARRVGGEEGEVDLGVRGRRELALGLLRRLAKALDDERVLGHIDAGALLELRLQVGQDVLVEILASQMCVAVGGLHLEHAAVHLQDRHIKRAAAKIVHGNGLAVTLLVCTPRAHGHHCAGKQGHGDVTRGRWCNNNEAASHAQVAIMEVG